MTNYSSTTDTTMGSLIEAGTVYSAPTLLEKLPRELRDEIYLEALTSPQDIIISNKHKDQLSTPGVDDKCGCSLPALLSVCKQIRHEATPIFYASNTFRAIAEDGKGLVSPLKWLLAISPENTKLFNKLFIEVRFGAGSVSKFYGAVTERMKRNGALIPGEGVWIEGIRSLVGEQTIDDMTDVFGALSDAMSLKTGFETDQTRGLARAAVEQYVVINLNMWKKNQDVGRGIDHVRKGEEVE
ncbi:hypothetical protein LTR08_007355 [Meristemomyces frigidus]|nr:hypothetical protein LTR08_007355 [Meristemomyces frigidus]